MRIVYPKKIAIGVDIGGTKIKAGLVDINGQIIGIPESIRTLAHKARPTDKENQDYVR